MTATSNIIGTNAIAAKTIALSTAIGENFVRTYGDKTENIVAKDRGKYLFESNITAKGIVLCPSADFADSHHPFDILVSGINKIKKNST